MKTMWQQLIAEFVGTFALIFIGAGSVIVLVASQTPGGVIGIALAHGLVLGIMISALGHISGGHFNPAVTVGVWVVGKIETLRAGLYVVTQITGGIAGGLLLRAALPVGIWKASSLGATLVSHPAGITDLRAVLLEGILTFFLVFTVFAVAIDDRGVFKSLAGLPIGLVLTFDILMGGLLTGASMNPARTLGPAIAGGNYKDLWVYLVGPVSGSIVAATLYWFSFLRFREVSVPPTETPIGGGPEEDLPS